MSQGRSLIVIFSCFIPWFLHETESPKWILIERDREGTRSARHISLLYIDTADLMRMICERPKANWYSLLSGFLVHLARRKRQDIRDEVIFEIANRSERCFSVTSRFSTATDTVSYSYPYVEQPKNRYEINPKMLTVDRTAELGKGAFAVVFKGTITMLIGKEIGKSISWKPRGYYTRQYFKE